MSDNLAVFLVRAYFSMLGAFLLRARDVSDSKLTKRYIVDVITDVFEISSSDLENLLIADFSKVSVSTRMKLPGMIRGKISAARLMIDREMFDCLNSVYFLSEEIHKVVNDNTRFSSAYRYFSKDYKYFRKILKIFSPKAHDYFITSQDTAVTDNEIVIDFSISPKRTDGLNFREYHIFFTEEDTDILTSFWEKHLDKERMTVKEVISMLAHGNGYKDNVTGFEGALINKKLNIKIAVESFESWVNNERIVL